MHNSNSNLYRIDDVLIRSGYIVLALAVAATFGLINDARSGPGQNLLFIAFFVAPAVMLWAGYRVRRRETRIVDLGRVLSRHHTVPIADLCEMTGFKREQLREAVALLNRKMAAGLSWQDEQGLVTRYQLQAHGFLAHAQRCESCGASVTIEVSANTSAEELRCTYCNGALDGQHISNLQMQLRQPPVQTFANEPAANEPREKPFRLGWFIFLMMFFWPGAVVYAIVKARAASASGNNPFL